MGNFNLDVDKFDGTRDYQLWKKKMKAILIERDLDAAIKKVLEFPSTFIKYQKGKLLKTCQSVLILHLTNNVLRECDELETIAEL